MTESDVAPLWNELRKINENQARQSTLLEMHMKTSTDSNEKIDSKLTVLTAKLDKAVSDTRDIYESLPEDRHGNPSTFIHKTQHASDRRPESDATTDGTSFWRDILKGVVQWSLISILGVCVVIFGLGLRDYIAHPVESQHLVREVTK